MAAKIWHRCRDLGIMVWWAVLGAGAVIVSTDMAFRVAENGNGLLTQFLTVLILAWGVATLAWCFWRGIKQMGNHESAS